MTREIPTGQVAVTACFDSFSQAQTIVSALDLFRLTNADDYELGTLRRWIEALYAVTDGTPVPCLDVPSNNGTCYRMDTTTEIFDFYPNNPFDRSDDEKTISGMSWVRFGDIAEDTPDWLLNALEFVGAERVGYFENDCFIAYDVSANPFESATNSLENFFNGFRDKNLNPFPTVTFRFEGTGQLEIEFAQVPFGGAVLVVWDFNPELNDILDVIQNKPNSLTNFQLIEVNRDLIGLPPELVTTTIWEQDFDDDIEHVVRCYFTPSGQLEPPFFLPFGGIREVEFCGVSVIGSETGNTYNQYNYKDSGSVRKGVLPVSTVDDFYDALIRYEDQRALRWLSGRAENLRGGIDIDLKDSGTLDGGKDFDIELAGLTSGLPSQVLDASNEEVLYGQALEVGNGFRELVAELVTWESNGVTMDTIVQRIAQFYKFGFGIDLNSTFATDFRDNLSTLIASATVNTTPVVDPVAIANLVYCNGNNKQSLYRYALDVEENGAVDPVAVANFYRLLIDNIDDEQLQEWYESGSSLPNTGYVNAPCYTPPKFDFIWTSAEITVGRDRNFDVQPSYSGERVFRLEISGEIVNGDGQIFNGVYMQNSSGTYEYKPLRLAVNPSPSALNLVPDIQPNNTNGSPTALTYTDANPSNAQRDGAYRVISIDLSGIEAFRAKTPLTGQLKFRLITLR
ncbi:MAG: hypothetical protein AAFR81_04015 [Chloroflexota bacterium]